MRTKLNLSANDRFLMHIFIQQNFNFTEEQAAHSYRALLYTSQQVWDEAHFGCTYQLRALAWYHHIYRPGSREHRAKIIISALLKAAQLDLWAQLFMKSIHMHILLNNLEESRDLKQLREQAQENMRRLAIEQKDLPADIAQAINNNFWEMFESF